MSVATVINHKGWVFEGVHNSYTVVLAVVTPSFSSPLASTPGSGLSTASTGDTPSRSSQPEGSDDLAVIYETFSETVDYSERHRAVLAHFRRWAGALESELECVTHLRNRRV